ncbi:MAG: ATP-binding protein [Thermodesulfobacteriota bacterium]|nr:ATP-binding protein [Thermodesulfobacteriota bacterium]
MIPRHLHTIISSRLRSFPAVALLGARQTGKTTLAKGLSPVYYDLEVESEKLRLDLQWDNIIASDELIILDEAQNFPGIFPRLRSAIDTERKRNGRFLILGSVSPGLMKEVSEFLTGRIAICELGPLWLEEMGVSHLDDMWLMGGFPDGGILDKNAFPVWQRNYLDLLAMRDLPTWGLPAKPQMTRRFFQMLAVGNGNMWNASLMGKSLGIAYHTVNAYLDYLEQAYLIRRLQPFHANIKKRLVKSPKVFWKDSGLLHSLLGIRNIDDLLVQPWVGISWECWVIEQILTCLNVHDIGHEPYYFRTQDGHELDLVLRLFGELWAFEIKLSSVPDKRELDRLTKTAEIIGADTRVLVSRTPEHIEGPQGISTNLAGAVRLIMQNK